MNIQSRKLFAVWASLLVICFAMTEVSVGQIRSGTITGTITDSAGANVPGAAVSVVNEETNIAVDVTTGEDGGFTAPYLAAGRYFLTINKTGFAPHKQTGIVVDTAQTVRLDVTINVGTVAETVEIQGAMLLQTETSDVSNQIGTEIIQSVPNANHNALYYATLQPGVVGRSVFGDTQSENSFGIGINARRDLSAISINGGQTFSNDVTLDGVSVQGSAWNEATVLPNQEGVREVRTSVNNFSAEYGRGQGVISLTTKSGGNDFHGSLFDYVRNEAFNANSYANNAQRIDRGSFKAHRYGGTVGGPIYLPRFGEGGPALFRGQNKAFFFVSFEGLHHDRVINFLRTVPTARERIGDFSETYENVQGAPARIVIYDPFAVAPIAGQTNQFARALIPGARLDQYVRPDGTRGVDPFALRVLNAYPLPNRTPDGDPRYNNNNYLRSDTQTFRRRSINSRLDFNFGNHSPYVTFGISRGSILTPRTWGDDNPFYAQNSFIGNTNSDNNPYGAIGDVVVLSPSLVLDVRYGINRINTIDVADAFDDFNYTQYGIPLDLQAFNHAPGVPFEYQAGSFSGLNIANSTHKQEHQTNHVFNGSLTKTRGNWTHKFGGEARMYLSNYIDPEESFWIRTDAVDTRRVVNATGGAAGAGPPANETGFEAASFLLGAGLIQMAEGRDIQLALAQKYFALYSQNDWKVTPQLTVNLGARWDLQPGATERYDRITAFDFTRPNPFGTQGVVVFPGVNGEGRNLWKKRYTDFAPRVGFAYRFKGDTVFRGGYGVTYLPSNTGYFDGTFNYGAATFSTFTSPDKFGPTPSGRIIGRYYEVNRVVPPAGADPASPTNYGGGTPRFDYTDYRSGMLQQWNLFVEKRFGQWLVSAGYIGTKGDHLPYSRVPVNNTQLIDPTILAGWRASYIQNNGSNPATEQICNPFQTRQTCLSNPNGTFRSATGPLIPFKGNLGRASIQRQEAILPYALAATLQVQRSFGYSGYNALQLSVNRRLSEGLQLNAHYTWSKSLDMTQTEAQTNQGYQETGPGGGSFNNYLDLGQNKKLSLTDTPHRFVTSFVYDLPVGAGRSFDLQSRVANAIFGGFRLSGVALIQNGYPLLIEGANNGSLNGRPDRVAGVPVELPKELQGWYDGRTTITLPSGRTITPSANTYLKFNPDAFQGRIVQVRAADGTPRFANDINWFGNAALTYDDIRSDGRQNLNMSLQRTFRLRENLGLDFAAQVTNLFNGAQFRPNGFNRGLGNTNTTNLPSGATASYGVNNNFGTHNLSTFDPRQIEFLLRLRF